MTLLDRGLTGSLTLLGRAVPSKGDLGISIMNALPVSIPVLNNWRVVEFSMAQTNPGYRVADITGSYEMLVQSREVYVVSKVCRGPDCQDQSHSFPSCSQAIAADRRRLVSLRSSPPAGENTYRRLG